jgi:hypothetical protein
VIEKLSKAAREKIQSSLADAIADHAPDPVLKLYGVASHEDAELFQNLDHVSRHAKEAKANQGKN